MKKRDAGHRAEARAVDKVMEIIDKKYSDSHMYYLTEDDIYFIVDTFLDALDEIEAKDYVNVTDDGVTILVDGEVK